MDAKELEKRLNSAGAEFSYVLSGKEDRVEIPSYGQESSLAQKFLDKVDCICWHDGAMSYVRFDDGFTIGTLCGEDGTKRRLHDLHITNLNDLAKAVNTHNKILTAQAVRRMNANA